MYEFLQWSRDRIFKKDDKDNFDKDLAGVINGIFPNVHSSLFTAFLILFPSSEIKYALKKEPNFYILGVSVSWSRSVGESEEDLDKRVAEMMKAKEISQKEETIQIILKYFHFWQTLTLHKDNISEDESKKWESFTKAERKSIVKRVRKEKLEKVKAEIESDFSPKKWTHNNKPPNPDIENCCSESFTLYHLEPKTKDIVFYFKREIDKATLSVQKDKE